MTGCRTHAEKLADWGLQGRQRPVEERVNPFGRVQLERAEVDVPPELIERERNDPLADHRRHERAQVERAPLGLGPQERGQVGGRSVVSWPVEARAEEVDDGALLELVNLDGLKRL